MHVKQVITNELQLSSWLYHLSFLFSFSFSNCTLPKGGPTLGLSGGVTGNTALGASVLVRMILFPDIIKPPSFSTTSTPAWCTTTSCHTTWCPTSHNITLAPSTCIYVLEHYHFFFSVLCLLWYTDA